MAESKTMRIANAVCIDEVALAHATYPETAKAIAEIEAAARKAVAAQLDAWCLSCATYFTKALWRELDAQIVDLGGESRDYWTHCEVKRSP